MMTPAIAEYAQPGATIPCQRIGNLCQATGRSAIAVRLAKRFGRRTGPASKSMGEGADLAIAQQPRDFGDRNLFFPEIAFGERLAQRLQHTRKGGALGR